MSRGAAVLVVLSLSIVVFAGCLDGEPQAKGDNKSRARQRGSGIPGHIVEGLPDPVLKCWTDATCNQEMTPDDGRQGNEVTIAVNPMNPLNIVGGAKDYYPADAGECVWDGVYVTHDGGATSYQDRSFDGSPWRATSNPQSFKPNYASQFWCTTDPVAYFSTKGTFYYLLMAYQADRVTGSKTGKDVIPRHPLGEGALNDWAFNRAVQIVAVSDDGGKTFHTFTPTIEGSYPVAFHDKGWIAASNTGVVHVMWLAGQVAGNTYMRSTDNGKSFPVQNLQKLNTGAAGQGSFLDVGPGKEVYAVWTSGQGQRNIQFRRSMDDGATWEAQKVALSFTGGGMPGISSRDRRGGFPAMATDRFADSPNAGAIYLVWQGSSSAGVPPDIYFSASYDKGTTFTPPVVINDDFLDGGLNDPANYQIFPAISVSPLGVIDVAWMDTRGTNQSVLKPNNGGTASRVGQAHQNLDEYHTYSLDGGRTWSRNFHVRDIDDGGWDPQVCHHQNGMIFIGDYNDIDSSWGAAHPAWPDSRSGTACDVYTAIVQRPIFPAGFDEDKKNTIRQKLLSEKLVDPDHPFLNQ
ncbi:MAG: exo-alpha-sialidase [Euryarchaeota archaeon]|nr:exo-alpha-sialidase [Euryarchaeota archaeon]